jgi:hypothetical protein
MPACTLLQGQPPLLPSQDWRRLPEFLKEIKFLLKSSVMSFLFLRIPWEREKPLGHQRL